MVRGKGYFVRFFVKFFIHTFILFFCYRKLISLSSDVIWFSHWYSEMTTDFGFFSISLSLESKLISLYTIKLHSKICWSSFVFFSDATSRLIILFVPTLINCIRLSVKTLYLDYSYVSAVSLDCLNIILLSFVTCFQMSSNHSNVVSTLLLALYEAGLRITSN